MEITPSLKNLDADTNAGVKSFLEFLNGTINNISIDNVNEKSITIAAPDWLFMSINKWKQVNRHFYTVINECYGIQLKSIRNQLSEKQFEQLQRNYMSKQLSQGVNPWTVHDICYDLIVYEGLNYNKSSNGYRNSYFISKNFDDDSSKGDERIVFLKVLIEKVITLTSAPLTFRLYKNEDDIKKRLSSNQFHFYEITFFDRVHNFNCFDCLIYTEKLKIIKDLYENMISSFLKILLLTKERSCLYPIELISCMRSFLCINRKTYGLLRNPYYEYIEYNADHNDCIFDRPSFYKTFFTFNSNDYFFSYNNDMAVCIASKKDACFRLCNSSNTAFDSLEYLFFYFVQNFMSIHKSQKNYFATFLKKIIEKKSKKNVNQQGEILFCFDKPLFWGKELHTLFANASLCIQSYYEKEDDSENEMLYKYSLTLFSEFSGNTKQTIAYIHDSLCQKLKEKDEEYEKKEKIFKTMFIKQEENYAGREKDRELEYNRLQDKYRILINQNETLNAQNKSVTKENDTLKIRLNEIQENMQIDFDNKINNLENEKRKLEEQNKLITKQYNELKNQNEILNIKIGLLRLYTSLIEYKSSYLSDVQEKNITLQNQLEKQKKYTLVATVGIGVLLVWIIWQYKNSISLLSQQNRILL